MEEKNIKKMRFGVLTKAGSIEIRERNLPPMGEYDVLLKQNSCNICTTDYGQWLGLREHQGYPNAPGHEGSGTIIAMGTGVKDFEIGDKVALACNSCGRCDHCRNGREGQCSEGSLYTEDGYKGCFGLADYFVVSSRRLIKMNKELPANEAGFLEPLSTVIRGLKKLRIKPQETVVVIGAGTMGLLNALTLRAYACRVIITEFMENKIENARSLGFEVIDAGKVDVVEKVKELTNGIGVDAVIVAVGNTKANSQAVEMVKASDGRISIFAAGFPAPQFNIDSNVIHYKRMEIIGTFASDYLDFMEAAKLLNSGAVKVSQLIEPKTFTLDTIEEAFKEAATIGKYRVSVFL